ncbi:chromosome partitioning protein, ParB family [Formivibrio citricus]|uniref:Chromosome partitioning protein, ParB family n=1 Tax=Formivibrio citricus TaxID=83765 RepID=A0A1I5AIZ4_9NEIS|nr:ParB/RepB/Spo0J family partition protein [Formivibrio citricus]SFN62451.1 chromosome partitioning protein, ParB family [Formivibrio citricus]
MNKKFKGLGRGLDALMGENTSESLQILPIAALQPGKYQPRTQMNPEALEDLAASIRAQGLMQPVLVRPVGDDRYEIVAGERRWRASELAGLTEIPTLVREIPDEAALAMALIENIQRENLNPLEEAIGIQRLIDEFDMTHEVAADAVGKSRTTVTNLLRLLNLTEPVRDMLMNGQLDMGHARALLPLDALKQLEAAKTVALKGLSVRETEALVKRIQKPAESKLNREVDPDVRRLQEEVSERIGARVTIAPGHRGAGKLVIDYASLEQLDGLLSMLK